MSEENHNKYINEYSEDSFWEKVKEFAKAAGETVIEKALTLYFCYLDADTPVWAKSTIIGALGYFIFPMDAIADIIPAVGYSDDLGVLVMALAAVAVHVKDSHTKQAREMLGKWFG